jgi:hypothetical protein
MKYATIILLTLITASCEKKQCWQCTLTQTTYGAGNQSPVTVNNTVCDKTEKEIRDYEKGASSTATARSGNVTVTITSITTCR